MMVRDQVRILLAGASAIGVLAGVLGAIAAARWPDPSTGAPVVAALADGRTGVFRFESYNAEWFDIPDGGYRAKPVLVEARLRLPREAAGQPIERRADRPLDKPAGRLPAIILLHGSGGLSTHEQDYAERFEEAGYATLVMDSFAARGVQDTVATPAAVTPWSMLVDAYRALALLQSHPRIDPARIALVGWSKGGMVADWASRMRYRKALHPEAQPGFAGHVAFYPWCGEQQVPVALTGAPMLYLVGQNDDWTGAEPCRDYAARAVAAGFPVRLHVFAGADHGFDHRGRFRRALPQAESWAGCNYLWSPAHFTIVATGKALPWEQFPAHVAECARRGAHAGSNIDARRTALRLLDAFLTEMRANPRPTDHALAIHPAPAARLSSR